MPPPRAPRRRKARGNKCSISCLLLLPLLTPLVVILAVLSYFKEARKADEQLKTKRDQIEGELPRFVATVEQSLKASRDVLAMLEAYKKNAGPAFAHEHYAGCERSHGIGQSPEKRLWDQPDNDCQSKHRPVFGGDGRADRRHVLSGIRVPIILAATGTDALRI